MWGYYLVNVCDPWHIKILKTVNFIEKNMFLFVKKIFEDKTMSFCVRQFFFSSCWEMWKYTLPTGCTSLRQFTLSLFFRETVYSIYVNCRLFLVYWFFVDEFTCIQTTSSMYRTILNVASISIPSFYFVIYFPFCLSHV